MFQERYIFYCSGKLIKNVEIRNNKSGMGLFNDFFLIWYLILRNIELCLRRYLLLIFFSPVKLRIYFSHRDCISSIFVYWKIFIINNVLIVIKIFCYVSETPLENHVYSHLGFI